MQVRLFNYTYRHSKQLFIGQKLFFRGFSESVHTKISKIFHVKKFIPVLAKFKKSARPICRVLFSIRNGTLITTFLKENENSGQLGIFDFGCGKVSPRFTPVEFFGSFFALVLSMLSSPSITAQVRRRTGCGEKFRFGTPHHRTPPYTAVLVTGPQVTPTKYQKKLISTALVRRTTTQPHTKPHMYADVGFRHTCAVMDGLL